MDKGAHKFKDSADAWGIIRRSRVEVLVALG